MSTLRAEPLTCFAQGQVADISAASPLPTAAFADTTAQQDATMVLVSSSVAARMDFTGGVPTSTLGIPIAVGEKFEVWGHDNIIRIKFIAASGKLDWAAFR